MKPSIITAVVIIALGTLWYFLLHQKGKHWPHNYHVVFQNAQCKESDLAKALTEYKIKDDNYKLSYDGKDWPPPGSVSPSPTPGNGDPSSDADPSTKTSHNVTQQVTFKSATDLANFLKAANLQPEQP